MHSLREAELLAVQKEYQEKIIAKKRRQRIAPGRRRQRKTWKRYIPNGEITTTVRLAIALRFFAGGSVYDIAPLYGVGKDSAFQSVWYVVEAVHRTNSLDMCFPQDHATQKMLARQFSRRSQAAFDCCVGAVDGILIWVLQPSPSCCKESKCDATKFFCGRKHKFGLNCQAVARMP